VLTIPLCSFKYLRRPRCAAKLLYFPYSSWIRSPPPLPPYLIDITSLTDGRVKHAHRPRKKLACLKEGHKRCSSSNSSILTGQKQGRHRALPRKSPPLSTHAKQPTRRVLQRVCPGGNSGRRSIAYFINVIPSL